MFSDRFQTLTNHCSQALGLTPHTSIIFGVATPDPDRNITIDSKLRRLPRQAGSPTNPFGKRRHAKSSRTIRPIGGNRRLPAWWFPELSLHTLAAPSEKSAANRPTPCHPWGMAGECHLFQIKFGQQDSKISRLRGRRRVPAFDAPYPRISRQSRDDSCVDHSERRGPGKPLIGNPMGRHGRER